MKLAVALLTAVCVAVVAAVVLGFAVGHLTPLLAAISLAAGAAGGIYSYATFHPSLDKTQKPTLLDWFVIICFALFALRAFCWLLFISDDDLSILSPNNFGDLPLHLTYMNYIARGA